MDSSGIIRRIDDLGRVVIPKEIRKTLRIKEGDPLEISSENDRLVFKKFSPVNSMCGFAEGVAESIKNLTDKNCIITDTDVVLYLTSSRKELQGKKISQELDEIIRAKKSTYYCRSEGGEPISICEDDILAENQIIVPIVNNGDCYGAVVLYDKDKEAKIDSSLMKMVQLSAMVLSKQFE